MASCRLQQSFAQTQRHEQPALEDQNPIWGWLFDTVVATGPVLTYALAADDCTQQQWWSQCNLPLLLCPSYQLRVCRTKPLSVRHGMSRDEHDTEGRLITAEYPSLYLVNAYIPNSGDGLKRLDYRIQQWDGHLAEYLQHLAKTKPVVLTGDLNCSHQEIDIHAPKRNLRSAGFTQVCQANTEVLASGCQTSITCT